MGYTLNWLNNEIYNLNSNIRKCNGQKDTINRIVLSLTNALSDLEGIELNIKNSFSVDGVPFQQSGLDDISNSISSAQTFISNITGEISSYVTKCNGKIYDYEREKKKLEDQEAGE